MKKKIKDLTLKELRKICKNNNCYNCPLYIPMGQDKCKDDLIEQYGNEEIEVEDDE